MTRVVTCGCGQPLNASDETEIFHVARRHLDESHSEWAITDAQLRDALGSHSFEHLFLTSQLLTTLQTTYPSRHDLQISSLVRISDGWECDVYAFGLTSHEDGKARFDSLILRIYSGHQATAKAIAEFDAMRKLHQVAYPVPWVILLAPDRSSCEKPFVLMEKIDGPSMGAAIGQSNEAQRQDLLHQFCKLFVELHGLDWRPFLTDTGRYPPARSVERWLDWAETLVHQHATPDFDECLRWLRERSAKIRPHALAIVHQDFHPYNILIQADGAAYVIDWTQADVADPRLDLAWTLLLMSGIYGRDMRDRILQEYERLAGAAVEDIAFFEVAAALKRLASIVISLRHGADKLGMRPGAETQMLRQRNHLESAAAFLSERTGLRVPAVEDLLTTLT